MFPGASVCSFEPGLRYSSIRPTQGMMNCVLRSRSTSRRGFLEAVIRASSGFLVALDLRQVLSVCKALKMCQEIFADACSKKSRS